MIEEGRLVDVRPFAGDPAPTELIRSWPEMVHSRLHAARPAVRRGSLEEDGGAKRGDGREILWLHPDDAAARAIEVGTIVRVHNDRGSCLASADVDAGVRPGVALLATGAFYDPDTSGNDRNANPNVLTPDVGTSGIGQGCAAQSRLVEVTPLEGTAPALTVYDPPQILPRDGVASTAPGNSPLLFDRSRS
ncbi:hypothetical protein JCR33_13965 [Acuticoccus sp. 2012]|uniref:Molybdopterin dinucleotide-binding domain-containing protein n=2 Tax=Acuticoccus mangrovi TaxID=2796142 RepID=A0A934IHZ0_9HYPH|nr:hypothetical protein [Acuticoccus mangrovi]